MSRLPVGAAAALALLLVGSCRTLAPAPDPATAPAAPPAPAPAPAACGGRPLSFQPRTGVTYRARVEEKRGVYRSSITYAPDGAGGWIAVERGFSLKRAGEPDAGLSSMSKAELRWKLDGRGVPVAEPEPKGYQGPCCLQSFSFFTFAPLGFANSSTCPGSSWNAQWRTTERERSFQFRIDPDAGPSGSATVSVDGLIKTSANERKIDGTFQVSLDDGLTGSGTLHVRGPDAPAVNDLTRQIQIAPAPPESPHD